MCLSISFVFFFFFQAEDGIRDVAVTGVQTCALPIYFEFKTFDGVSAYDELLRRTDSKLVQLELDCYWITRAGKDPLDYFKQYPGRFPLWHIKDRKPGYAPATDMDQGPGPFTEVGRGSIDWPKIFSGAREAGVKHYYVEQDFCERPPLESAKISYDYLKGLKA